MPVQWFCLIRTLNFSHGRQSLCNSFENDWPCMLARGSGRKPGSSCSRCIVCRFAHWAGVTTATSKLVGNLQPSAIFSPWWSTAHPARRQSQFPTSDGRRRLWLHMKHFDSGGGADSEWCQSRIADRDLLRARICNKSYSPAVHLLLA